MPALAVELRNVGHQYGHGAGTVHARAGVDLDLPRGTFTAVMCPPGTGKSTFCVVPAPCCARRTKVSRWWRQRSS